MTTATGAGPNDRYGDEVLNANWLPEILLPVPPRSVHGLQRRPAGTPQAAEADVDEFMRRLYRVQE